MHGKSLLLDMDGVLVRGRTPVPGAEEFLRRLDELGRRYLVLTNNSIYTQQTLPTGWRRWDSGCPPSTSSPRRWQRPVSSTPSGPAERRSWWGRAGSPPRCTGWVTSSPTSIPTTWCWGRVVSTSRRSPPQSGSLPPALPSSSPTRTWRGPRSRASCLRPARWRRSSKPPAAWPYVVGKPNPFMVRSALNHLDVHSEDTVMVGDNLHTDIKGGMESGLETILVLSGMTSDSDVARSPYRPNRVVASVADIEL